MVPSPRILVVDDDDAARRMMRRILERRGYEVEDAPNGRAGVDRIQAGGITALILDLRMPGELSGLATAALLRESGVEIPIIACSASVHGAARGQTAAAGCNAFVSKPVDFDELYATLASLGVMPPDAGNEN